jgi:hypothetical protein
VSDCTAEQPLRQTHMSTGLARCRPDSVGSLENHPHDPWSIHRKTLHLQRRRGTWLTPTRSPIGHDDARRRLRRCACPQARAIVALVLQEAASECRVLRAGTRRERVGQVFSP